MQGLDSSFDAVLFVSYHGSIGAPAGLSHTYNARAVTEARLGGVVTGEAALNALVAAHYGVPVVLVTGDRCACEEAAALIPGVYAAVVKNRQPAGSAQPAPGPGLRADPGDVRESGLRRAGRATAAARRGRAGDLRPHQRHRGGSQLGPGVERTGERELRFTGADPLAVYRAFCAAILLTRGIAEDTVTRPG